MSAVGLLLTTNRAVQSRLLAGFGLLESDNLPLKRCAPSGARPEQRHRTAAELPPPAMPNGGRQRPPEQHNDATRGMTKRSKESPLSTAHATKRNMQSEWLTFHPRKQKAHRNGRAWCIETIWSGKRGSNSRPIPWQGIALPTELFPHFYCLVAWGGIEPPTQGFSILCSTD
jgi:hypothetical protein